MNGTQVAAIEGVLPRLRSAYRSLPEAEQLVARFIESQPRDTVRLPVKTLSERIGVSEASIIRCCRSIGFRGLRDLKFALAGEIQTPLPSLHEDILATDSVLAIAQKVLQSDIQAISETIAVLDGALLERAVDTLLAARRIECYGIGSSLPLAIDAYYRFLRIGLPASIVTDPHMQVVSASHLPPGSVAFVISHTGRTKETLDALRRAKSAGATGILITSYSQTPIGRVADIELITSARETAFRTEAMASRIAHLSVIDALYIACAMRRFDTSLASLDEANAIIEERRVQ